MRDFAEVISTLEALFQCLPHSLPLDPSDSHLNFELDESFIESEGWGPEFNRRMEIAWRSWEGPIYIPERGARLAACIQLLREAVIKLDSSAEQETWVGGWLDKLLEAARRGQNNTKQTEQIVVDDVDEKDDPPIPVPIPKPQKSTTPLILNGKLNFPHVSREEYREQSAERAKTLAAERVARAAALEARKEQSRTDARERERVRKAAYRARLREKDVEDGKRDVDGHLIKPTSTTVTPAANAHDELGVAHAAEQLLQAARSTSKSDKLAVTSKRRTCWQRPGLWVHILAAVKAEGIEYACKHPTSVIKRLQTTHKDTGLFNTLHESTLGQWFTTDATGRTCWKQSVLDRVAKKSGHGGRGRSKKLSAHPRVLEGAIRQLRALRLTSTPISCGIARSILLGHLRIHAPELSNMPLSTRWIQRFMRDQLGWSYRTATKAARKRPSDWEAQGLLAFLRMVRTIDQYQVKSARMIVNADQTGISLLPTGKKTWETVGKSQVSSLSHEERRQFTAVVASSCGGDILPFQSVWGGKIDASLPKATASRRAEADALGFTYVHGDTRHWSSLETTKTWVKTTLVPHFERVRAEENLPVDSPGILYIDAWPVHTAKSNPGCFIPWMSRNYPWIKLIFVPAGCTGELQPADTLLQRIVKHVIKVASMDFFVACSTRQLQAGKPPEEVSLPTDLPTLRDASVAWTLEAFNYLQRNPQIVSKAWEKCQTGEWNFTWSKLTCSAAKDLFYSTLSTNEEFRNELGASGPIIPRSKRGVAAASEPLDEEIAEFLSSEDDPSIPVSELHQQNELRI